MNKNILGIRDINVVSMGCERGSWDWGYESEVFFRYDCIIIYFQGIVSQDKWFRLLDYAKMKIMILFMCNMLVYKT